MSLLARISSSARSSQMRACPRLVSSSSLIWPLSSRNFVRTTAKQKKLTIMRKAWCVSSTKRSLTSSSSPHRKVSMEERAAFRAARRERATKLLQQQQDPEAAVTSATESTTGSAVTAKAPSSPTNTGAIFISRLGWWAYVGGLLVPTGLVIWAANDENSPPAKISQLIGLSSFIGRFVENFAKPSHDKLLPDWSQMPNVPHDIPTPHTLVLDLEGTLVGSTWDRKYGWRHARRPGLDKFLHEMAQYYEIVLYSPSYDAVADPVVNALDKDGCIMHRLYREATHFWNGIHVKDLNRLNRNVKRMVVLDDDPAEVQFNPENLIRVKPYTDPSDQSDNTLARITPFLIEIAREGYSDIPTLLKQYEGMDADEIADEQDRRVQKLKQQRQAIRDRGLGFLASNRSSSIVEPELPPSATVSERPVTQLTAKDIAGSVAASLDEDAAGLVGFLNRRAKEKEEHQQRKMEKWHEVMMRKQKEKAAAAQQ